MIAWKNKFYRVKKEMSKIENVMDDLILFIDKKIAVRKVAVIWWLQLNLNNNIILNYI